MMDESWAPGCQQVGRSWGKDLRSVWTGFVQHFQDKQIEISGGCCRAESGSQVI